MGRGSSDSDDLFYGKEIPSQDIPNPSDPRFLEDPDAVYVQHGRKEEWSKSDKEMMEMYDQQEESDEPFSGGRLLSQFTDDPAVYNIQLTWKNKRSTRFGTWIVDEIKTSSGEWELKDARAFPSISMTKRRFAAQTDKE